MPRNIPHFTRCAPPGEATDRTGVFWLGIGLGVASLALIILSFIFLAESCVLSFSAIGTLITYGAILKRWYYTNRLMCIRKDVCVIGTMIARPSLSSGVMSDGDRKLDLLIAPFRRLEVEDLLREAVNELRDELPGTPVAADLGDRNTLFSFVRGLSVRNQKKVYMKLVREKMLPQPDKDFQLALYIRDETVIGTDAFNATPDDTPEAENPNLMFRFSGKDDEDSASAADRVVVPWLHCEIEGDRLGNIIDAMILAGVAGILTILILCGICGPACGWIGGIIALILMLLAWLLGEVIPNGQARDADIDFPTFGDGGNGGTTVSEGDVIVVTGDWVMDMEHNKYFEVHPVKSFYLLCRSGENLQDWNLTEETPASACEFDPGLLTAEDAGHICKLVKAAENTDPAVLLTIPVDHALSMAGGLDNP